MIKESGIVESDTAFEAAWAKRPWTSEDETGKDRARRWWNAGQEQAAILIAELQAERANLNKRLDAHKATIMDAGARILAAESSLDRVRETTWQPIETAPKDGTEINGYRPDQGVFTFRWAFMDELVSHDQNGDPVEDFNDHEGWWHDRWGWMEGELTPTHWQPLPATPPQQTDAVALSRATGGDA